VLRTPESKAWAVVIVGFVLFCTIAVSVPLAIRSHIIHATTVEMTVLEEPIDGVVYVKELGGQNLSAIRDRKEIPEGTTIATDEHLRAFLRLFDGSTLTVYNNTEIILERIRSPRYAASPKANDIQIRVTRGRVGIAVASPIKATSTIVVHSPHAYMTLKEGSYSVVVDASETQITVRTIRPGEATITTPDEHGPCSSGRCRIVEGHPIEGLPIEQNLIVNSDFTSPLGRGWEVQPSQRDVESDPYGEAEIVVQDGETLLSLSRVGARTHGETSIIQRIDKDVRDFDSLKVSFEVLVNWQSLLGGGYESTEFPVMVELQYKDANGNSRSQYWGFYHRNPGTGREWRKMVNGTKVPQGEWYLFETDNLMRSLGDIKPVRIDGVRVYASGWDWDSAITNISLLVQE
jgi:FecR-like protein